jgi:hypothetical protein
VCVVSGCCCQAVVLVFVTGFVGVLVVVVVCVTVAVGWLAAGWLLLSCCRCGCRQSLVVLLLCSPLSVFLAQGLES